MSEQNQLIEIETVVAATNAVSVPDAIKAALVADLQPIAERLAGYQVAAGMSVTTDEQAKLAAGIVAEIDADIKAVNGCETMDKIIKGLHGLHRQWTAARAMFADPLDKCKRAIRGAVLTYQQEQQRKAAELQRKLQAEADERARKEQARLEAQAAKLKTPELREARMEQAAQVVAPVVTIPVQQFTKTRKVWKVTDLDMAAFLAAAATNPMLHGYVEIKVTALERSKAANLMLAVPGVTFEQVCQ